eukprot:XP_015573228.1 probable receptor-like protein kinase At5g39030 [Ricinus communis]
MMLEMFGGRSNIDIGVSHTSQMYSPDSIHKYLESSKIYVLHANITDEEEETVRKVIIIGLWCIQTNISDRPSMTRVVEILEGSFQSLQIPPKPFCKTRDASDSESLSVYYDLPSLLELSSSQFSCATNGTSSTGDYAMSDFAAVAVGACLRMRSNSINVHVCQPKVYRMSRSIWLRL